MLTDYLHNDIPILQISSIDFPLQPVLRTSDLVVQEAVFGPVLQQLTEEWAEGNSMNREDGWATAHGLRKTGHNWAQHTAWHRRRETALLPKEAMIILRGEQESIQIHYSNSPITCKNLQDSVLWSIIYLANIWPLYIAAYRNRLTKCISLCKLDVPIYRRWDCMRKFKIRTKSDIIIHTISRYFHMQKGI